MASKPISHTLKWHTEAQLFSLSIPCGSWMLHLSDWASLMASECSVHLTEYLLWFLSAPSIWLSIPFGSWVLHSSNCYVASLVISNLSVSPSCGSSINEEKGWRTKPWAPWLPGPGSESSAFRRMSVSSITCYGIILDSLLQYLIYKNGSLNTYIHRIMDETFNVEMSKNPLLSLLL